MPNQASPPKPGPRLKMRLVYIPRSEIFGQLFSSTVYGKTIDKFWIKRFVQNRFEVPGLPSKCISISTVHNNVVKERIELSQLIDKHS